MNKTDIQWTKYSSNPLVAYYDGKRGWFCSHASPGCEHCYSETLNKRFGNGLAYLAPNVQKIRFELNERELETWLKLKPGDLVFPFDMTDIFHAAVPLEMQRRCFEQMHRTDATFQVLTKRTETMLRFAEWWFMQYCDPHPNVWWGTSVEDQRRWRERVPLLRQIPGVLRWLSIEPLLEDLGEIDLTDIGWVVVGGESGGGARNCNVEWIENVVLQCQEQQVPVFVKQLGSQPFQLHGDEEDCTLYRLALKDRKGGKPEEWAPNLRVRQMPEPAR